MAQDGHTLKRLLLGFLFLSTLLTSTWLALQIISLDQSIRSIRDDLLHIWQEKRDTGQIDSASLSRLRFDLEKAEARLRRLQRVTAPLADRLAHQHTWPWARRIGIVWRDGLTAAQELTTAGWWAALRAESAAELLGTTSTAPGIPFTHEKGPIESALEAISRERPRLRAARQALARVQVACSEGGWPFARLSPYTELAPLALDVALITAPILTGDDQPHNILVILQNSDEIRATGGFVSSVAVFRFKGHRLIGLDYMDSYDVDADRPSGVEPPEPFSRYMQAEQLMFRDANWSPDYPTSAEVIASLYEAARDSNVSAVVAVDTQFLQSLLEALGPLPVPEYDLTLTAENALEIAESLWESPVGAPSIRQRDQHHQWRPHRKDFGRVMLQAGLARAKSLRPDDLIKIAQAVNDSISRKHFLVWVMDDPEAQRDLLSAGMAGEIRPARGDYLMVVDTNMGWNKVDRHIRRSFDYRLDLEATPPQAQLCLTYTNTATANLPACIHKAVYYDTYEELTQQCYWNYVRVLVPNGSELVAVSGTNEPVDVARESYRESFGTLLVVAPGESQTVCFTYALPAHVLDRGTERWEYELLIQKQGGTDGTTLCLVISPPAPDAVPNLVPPWRYSIQGPVFVEDVLDTDRHYRLSWSKQPINVGN